VALDLYSLAVILLGLSIGSFIKGLTGMGLPLISIPFMAAFVGAEHAIVVMQIPGVVSNAWLVGRHAGELRTLELRPGLIVPAILMTVVGVWFLDLVDDRVTILLLAGVVALVLALHFLRPEFHLDGRTGRLLTPAASAVGGFVQGASGVSGPLFSTLIFSLRLGKGAYILHNALLFGIFNAIQAVAMIFFDMWTWQRFAEGCLALIPLFVFQYAGMRTLRRVSARAFNRAVLAVIVLMELKLLWEGFKA